ncbi:hypothetical protein NBRC116584_22440 [Hydrogenophaga sp. 5NK40-0174]
MLKVRDLESTKAFYRDKLRFRVCDESPEATPDAICKARLGGATLTFTTADLWPGEPGMTGILYVHVDDVVAYYAQVHASVTVTWPLQTRSDDTKEFGVLDCNGYTLAFAQSPSN